jgi:hypothetical protein
VHIGRSSPGTWRPSARSSTGTGSAGCCKCLKLTDGTYNAVGFDYLGSDDHAIALSHLTARRGDRMLEIDEAVIFTVREGRFVEAYHLAYDQYAWDEFFA